MDGLERDYGAKLDEMRVQAARAGPPGGILRMRFDPSGERLYLATMVGLRAYSWEEIASTDGALPNPVFASDGAASTGDAGYDSASSGDCIFDVEFDPHDRILFAGKDGRVRFLDGQSGRCEVLLELPSRPPIHRLVLSRDRAVLARDCSCLIASHQVAKPAAR